MSNYPDWVNLFKSKGTSIKKVRDKFYLYKHTSTYVKGRKSPKVTDKYLGVITPDGIKYSRKHIVTMDNIEVYEYGFSFALIHTAPAKWKEYLGDQWYMVISAIIREYAPNSFFLKDLSEVEIPIHNIALQKKKLFCSIDIDELLLLKDIYMIVFDECNRISKITEKQKEILDKYHLDLTDIYG